MIVSTTNEETLALLQGVPVFSTLSVDALEQLAEVTVPRTFDAGEIVFHEGDSGDTCYVVRSGRARAIREHADGRSIALATFGPGEIFGELSMFDSEVRSATVEVTEDMVAVALLAADMRRLLREHPEISMKLLTALGQRLRDTSDKLARQSFQTVQSRVASVLAELVAAAQSEPGDHSDAPRSDVVITATQTHLAQLAGSSRESASRFLAVLERAGVITQRRGRLVVHDPARLDGYVY